MTTLRRVAPLLALAATPFLFFWPAAAGRVVLAPNDGVMMFLPLRVLAGRQLAAGQAPLWNPWVFSGVPLLADMLPGVLYPFNWLFLCLPPLAAMNVLMLGTLAVAGLGTYAYARAVGCPPAAACFSGLTFSFCGFLMARFGNTPVFQGAAWLPLLLLSLERLRHRAGLGTVVLGAAAVALSFFAGHPQVPVHALMTAGLYALFFALAERPPIGRARFVLLAGATLGSGLLLAAVQLLPTAELGAVSVRTRLSYEDFTAFSLSPRHLATLLFPYLFTGWFAGLPEPSYWGELERMGYAGVGALMLAGAALAGARTHSIVCFWALFAAWSLLLALGDTLPLARLMHHVPIANMLRIPTRHLLEFDLAVAVLAGLGLTRGLTRTSSAALARAGVGMLAVALAIAALWVGAGPRLWSDLATQVVPGGFTPAAEAFSLRDRAVWVPLVLTVLAAAVLVGLARRPRGWLLAALLALQAIDLFLFARSLPTTFPSAERALREPLQIAYLRRAGAGPSDQRTAYATPGGTAPLDGRAVLWGEPTIQGYDSLLVARYGEFVSMDYAGRILEAALRYRPLFLDLLNARFLVLFFPERPASSVRFGDLRFAQGEVGDELRAGDVIEFPLPAPQAATAIGAVTLLGAAPDVPDGAPVARITATTAGGEVVDVLLRAGEHTAEWAWDRPDVAPVVRHRRAPIIESFPAAGCEGHKYAAVLEWGRRIEVSRVRIEQIAPSGTLQLSRLTLYDRVTGRSHPLTALHGLLDDRERWARRFSVEIAEPAPAAAGWLAHEPIPLLPMEAEGGRIEVLENLRVRPRAWLVPRTLALDAPAVLHAVRDGRLPDGGPFDPAQVALVEDVPARDFAALDPAARVEVVARAPALVELLTRSVAPAFLVLSETFYPGWTATIDGVGAPIVRTNYVLRGLEVPAGEHRIRFAYDPQSVKIGAAISAVTVALFAALGVRRGRPPHPGAPSASS